MLSKLARLDAPLSICILILLIFSLLVLNSIAKFLFPLFFLYIFLGILAYFLFSQVDFDIISLFSNHFYVLSIVLLILPYLIGQITRGAVRWIPIGPLTIQPAEIVRPFLLIFFANYLTAKDLNPKKILKAFGLFLLPLVLIFAQPSLGVALLTTASFLGVILASEVDRRYLLVGVATLVLLIPLTLNFLAPYQKLRLKSFLDPYFDPAGAGYSSIQSVIGVGSGRLWGRGLGRGVQTQLKFLPERHTDFVFASVSEELGFLGAILLTFFVFFLILRLSYFMENSKSSAARAYLSGLFFTLFSQIFINIGMNLGLMPITGVPLPLVSAGGSSLIATLISLGIANGTLRRYT